jgi:predicted RNA binding protein YcfA (HicA-like mRNA interferase family)
MFLRFQEGERRFLEALVRSHADINVRDVMRMFKMAGYELDRIKGSHHVFVPTRGKGPTITLPFHSERVKVCYVKRAIRILFPDI